MNIAFYAPMKSPEHPNPSGDRRIARLLMAALERCGHEVHVASQLRSRDGSGSAIEQRRIRDAARLEGERLIKFWSHGKAPDLFFTYHLFHKAPDWLGPAVCTQLGLPYVVAEASYAPKQEGGPWHSGHQQVKVALGVARGVVTLNPVDLECVLPHLSGGTRLVSLPAFLDPMSFATPSAEVRSVVRKRFNLRNDCVQLVTVAMMRPGDKLASFSELALTLAELEHTDRDWQLVIIGGGSGAAKVRRMFQRFDAERIQFAGALDTESITSLLPGFDIFVWPAVNEAIGLAMLEAQAAGLPVVSTRQGAVATIVQDQATGILVPPGDIEAMARATQTLIENPGLRNCMSRAAIRAVRRDHSIDAAAVTLNALLHSLKSA